jgi:hypothetical protein
MGGSQSAQPAATTAATPATVEPTQTSNESTTPQKLKPCCACPETKKARDQWFIFLNLISKCFFN